MRYPSSVTEEPKKPATVQSDEKVEADTLPAGAVATALHDPAQPSAARATSHTSPSASPLRTRGIDWFNAGFSAVAALGTVGLFWIALTTLDPIIENLEIRTQNRELKATNDVLQDRIRTEELNLKEREAHRRILERDNAALSERLGELKNEVSGQRDLLKQLLDEERQRRAAQETLLNQVVVLQDERTTLRTEKEKLTIEQARLLEEIKTAEQQLGNLGQELERVAHQRDMAWQSSRRFILEQIRDRARAQYSEWSGWAEDATKSYWSSLFSVYSLSKVGSLGYLDKTRAKTGREFVESEFRSSVFQMLEESPRSMLRNDIIAFTDTRREIFEESLLLDSDVFKQYTDALSILAKTIGSSIFAPNPLSLGTEPETVSADELARRENHYNDASAALQREQDRIDTAVTQFVAALNEMVEALGPLPK